MLRRTNYQFRPQFRPTGRYARGQQTPKAVRLCTAWGILLAVVFTTISGVKMISHRAVTEVANAGVVQQTDTTPHEADNSGVIKVALAKADVAPSSPTTTEMENIDVWTGKAIDEIFAGQPSRQSEMRMIMHCLLFHESRHDEVKGKGDGGMAAGPLQFWSDTWVRMRTEMINQGYATQIGSLYDEKEAIRTTVWAISPNYLAGKEWGPIYRAARGSDWNTCPIPSWGTR